MLEDKDKIKVRNRKKGSIGYQIPDLSVNRIFRQGEVKELTMEELRKLKFIPGGNTLLQNYLLVENEEAIKELIGNIEPEYNYTEKEIEWLLLNGSIEQLADCLNFAPLGVIDLVKNLAVDLKIDNMSKRRLIESKTGLNVTRAIEIKEDIEKEKQEDAQPEAQRRATPVILTDNAIKEDKKRQSELPNYTVISKK